nr:MAG TPA: chromosome segregation ATPase [Bacteriophage sp.]
MAFDWEHVEAIRAEQNSARNRRDLNVLPTDETSERIYNSPTGTSAKVPKLDHWEQMIQKVRTQLIDYIISHGLVQGFEYDGIDEPIKNGKIVLTADMLKRVTDRFGYFREKETREFIETYLPEHFYVSDENYVHTDNNYTGAEKDKLSGIADGAEVNKVISILFNGVESINPETRVATITITPADVKAWYEQNPDTNAFTDAEKAKLESIDIDALSNKVEDVTLDGETIVKNKVAVLTAKKIKDSYESNPDSNAFTDADKALVEQVLPEVQKTVNQHEKRLDDLEKSQTTQDAEIADVKNSISELGDEVNSVAGRVTTLESSQKAQDGEISTIKEKDTEQDGRLDTLEASDTTQDADILQLKEDVKNAGKVDDVQVDGTSVVEDKIAKIPKVYTLKEITDIINNLLYNYVPYADARKDVDLNGHSIWTSGQGMRVNLTGNGLSAYSGATVLVSKGHQDAYSVLLNPDDGIILKYPTSPVRESITIKQSRISLDSLNDGKQIALRGIISGLAIPTADDFAANKKYVDDAVSALTTPVIKRIELAVTIPEITGGVSVPFTPNSLADINTALGTPPTGKKWALMSQMVYTDSDIIGAQEDFTYCAGRQTEFNTFDYAPGGRANFPSSGTAREVNATLIAYYIAL